MRTAGRDLLDQARALRAAYPDAVALRAVPIRGLPQGDETSGLCAALRYLRAEMARVQDGTAGGLWVLGDEIKFTERAMAVR